MLVEPRIPAPSLRKKEDPDDYQDRRDRAGGSKNSMKMKCSDQANRG
jgi:hypothetical protein